MRAFALLSLLNALFAPRAPKRRNQAVRKYQS
jgi:hypothetical protein